MSKVSTPLDSKRHSKLSSKKRTPVLATPKPERRATSRSFVVPNVVPRDSSDGKDSRSSRGEQFTPAKAASTGRSVQTRRASNIKHDVERPLAVESRSSPVPEKSSFEDKYPTVKIVEKNVSSSPGPSKVETGEYFLV